MAKKITKKDWAQIEQFITDELETRKRSEFRTKHERIWKEVDRQVHMEPLQRIARDRKITGDWRNAIELGELSRASEVITADIRRVTFPQTRSWFEAHTQIEEADVKVQTRLDGRLRAMMTQQQIDFGFKARLDLSVKEALHHGSYVATVNWENSLQVSKGTGVETLSAPVWRPHSMWNCYPDPSVGPTNTFYQGSMIIKSFKPKYQVKKMVSEDPNYPFFNLNKVEEEDDKDIELIYFYGDIVVDRSKDSLLLLNSRAILANGTIIHYMPNPRKYNPVIYNGWERLDVRDPYYVSPLVKFSAEQKVGSILANRFLDAVDLRTEPPGVYDGNDPDFMANGGPSLAPGDMTPSKHGGKVEFYNVGDPASALSGLQFMISQIEAGTKVDRVRSGVSSSTEQTATEVIKQSQNAELSTVDFVDKHESHGLRPALYMMHDLNLEELVDYKFYNQELDAPDFEVMKQSELPKNVHFEITGSKGLLDEERRQSQTSQVAAFWFKANPQMLNQQELAMEMFRDAGNKNPERFLNIGDQAEQFQQQIQAVIQQAQQQIGELQQELASFQMQDETYALKVQEKELEKQDLQNKIDVLKGIIQLKGAADDAVRRVSAGNQNPA